MRALAAALVLLLATFLLAALQNTADDDSERTRILALENAWNRAEEHKDVKALDGLLASTLVYIDYDGSLMKQSAVHGKREGSGPAP